MDFTLHESILVIVSVLLTAACFNIALFFGYNKKSPYLFFAFYCIFHCFKIYLKTYPDEEILVPLLNLNAYQLVYLSVIFGMLSLSTFLAYHFSLPYTTWFLGIYVVVSFFFFFFIEELDYIVFSLIVAITQTIFSSVQNKNALLILLGLLGFAFCVGLGFRDMLNWGYFVGVIFLIFCMALSSSIELAAQNREYQEALLRSSRLENQLLKTTIQPHFILNSLTSLQELIESDPAKASHFVQDLSKEFKLFAKISDQDLIPVSDEIELVASYLKIMSIRKSTAFKLNIANLSEDDDIPPGVFLTLIENGITHGYENRKEGLFSISKAKEGEAKVYSITNDGEVNQSAEQMGMGHNYVIARLRETYGNKFKFESFANDNGWLSKITVWK